MKTLITSLCTLLATALLAVPSAAVAPTTTALLGGPIFSNPLVFDNEFFPFTPGGVKVYTGKDEGAKTVVVDLYSTETRMFDVGGSMVECALLQETEFEDGELAEISLNWFAQADDGTVYYFGEVVDNYDDGEIEDHEGSWLVGGPQKGDPEETATALVPAVFMPADPEVGDTWKPEDLFPLVDETVEVLKEDVKFKTPAEKFEGGILVQETTDLDPKAKEKKWYAPGVGFGKAKGPGEKLVLIASTFTASEDEE